VLLAQDRAREYKLGSRASELYDTGAQYLSQGYGDIGISLDTTGVKTDLMEIFQEILRPRALCVESQIGNRLIGNASEN
jgi:hypothetical protein